MRKGKLKGWRGIGPEAGEFVPADEGFEYICTHVGIGSFDYNAPDAAEFKAMLVEWFFSGNWIEEYEEE
jgi:hypothetical protein